MTTQVQIEDLLKRCGSVYRAVLLAAKRAKELASGAPPLVETPARKATSVALEEILQGKVLYKSEEEGSRAGKRGRGAKAKEDKKKR
jgi:DNA-directed RNA polymerase subunit omega